MAEFRALWGAQLLSVAGDQLARVALTVLVYDRTRSALLAAVAYAASIVPVFAGGILLSGIADRRPRRQVMIACDLGRVPLAALMAVPGMPLAALILLLSALTAIGAPFGSARAAIYPEVLGEARYPIGTAVTMTGYQFAQVAGFAVGGAVVGLAGPPVALSADAATFVISAVLVRARVQNRPAAAAGSRTGEERRGDLAAGIRLVFGQRPVRTPMLLGWTSAFYNVPEGLAVAGMNLGQGTAMILAGAAAQHFGPAAVIAAAGAAGIIATAMIALADRRPGS